MHISSTEDRDVIELNILRDIDVNQSVKGELIAQIRQRFKPTFIKIRAEFDIECYSYEGINAIIASLLAGERCGNATAGVRSVKIKLLTSPTYIMTTLASENDLGISTLNRCLETIRTNIISRGGSFMLRMSPRALTQHEEGCFDLALKRLVDEETHRQDLRHEDDNGDDNIASASGSESSTSDDS
jgi:translation initiation factor 2 subunit 1